MHNLIELAPYGKNGEIQMVVETPRGSNIKLKYEPKLRAFTVSRALPLGLIDPYDWGFIPGTKGEMEIQLMPWHSMTEPPILAWSYPAARSELLNLSRKKKHKARCKIRASFLCLSGTIALEGCRLALSDQRRNRAISSVKSGETISERRWIGKEGNARAIGPLGHYLHRGGRLSSATW